MLVHGRIGVSTPFCIGMVSQREEVLYLNKNEYRRALIMLRSLKSGVSGYIRLECRTLMGTLQFTINGITESGERYAVLLYRSNGTLGAIKLDQFPAPRYGQTGLVWKFDPRNIESRALEQYPLAAVIEIRDGICDLLLCGNLNGAFDTDWLQVREAACRLFSPVRISGAPISPIDDKKLCPEENDSPQLLPDYSEELPAYPGDSESNEQSATAAEQSATQQPETAGEHTESNPSSEKASKNIPTPVSTQHTDCMQSADCSTTSEAISPSSAEISRADGFASEADELDIPAQDEAFMAAAQHSQPDPNTTADIEADDLDMPAQDDFHETNPAGSLLQLNDPSAAWPDLIEPLRSLFFSSEAIVPFETDGFVFIRAPLPEESGISSCLIGIRCENGLPDRVCYAIPSPYTPEPPVGLEGYVWRGDHTRGYWVICEQVGEAFTGATENHE